MRIINQILSLGLTKERQIYILYPLQYEFLSEILEIETLLHEMTHTIK